MYVVRMEKWIRGGSVFAGSLLALSLVPAAAAPPPAATPTAVYREQDVPSYAPLSASERTVGRIEIPRVGVSAMILEGVDYKTIRRAVGHFPESPMPHEPGNMALAAHRTTDFAGLRDIRIGDEVTVTSSHGTFRYVVERTLVVDPEDVWVLDPSSDKELTLVTCYPFDYKGSAPHRLIVRAQAVPVDPTAESPSGASPTSTIARAPLAAQRPLTSN